MLDVTQTAVPQKATSSDGPLFSATNRNEVRWIKAWLDANIKVASKLPPNELISESFIVTPAMAEYILVNHNKGNRPLRASRVAYFSTVITEGDWIFTHQGLSFAKDGTLNNGQHRLHGIVRAGRPVPLYFTFGEDRSAFVVIDAHGVRGGSDTLMIAGYKNWHVCAAAARVMHAIEEGRMAGASTVDNNTIKEVMERHPGLDDAATVGGRIAKKFKTLSGGATVAAYLIKKGTRHPDRFDWFLERLIDGADLPSRHPILKLRDALATKTVDGEYKSHAARSVAQAAAIVKAWNYTVTGRRTWSAPKPGEAFPTVE